MRSAGITEIPKLAFSYCSPMPQPAEPPSFVPITAMAEHQKQIATCGQAYYRFYYHLTKKIRIEPEPAPLIVRGAIHATTPRTIPQLARLSTQPPKIAKATRGTPQRDCGWRLVLCVDRSCVRSSGRCSFWLDKRRQCTFALK